MALFDSYKSMVKGDPLADIYRERVTMSRKDPFRPRPEMLQSSKSRRHHPIMQREGEDNFCIRASRCKNKGKCDACVPLYRLWKERK